MWNNPLNATDPSGYFLFTLAAIALVAKMTFTIQAVIGIFALAGALDALVQGASLMEALFSGAIAGWSAGAFSAIGQALAGVEKFAGAAEGTLNALGLTVKAAAHGVVGGFGSYMQGGKFGHGFASAAISAAATTFNDKHYIGNKQARIALAGVIGGTASKISGGKFANGAITAALSHTMNHEGEWDKRDDLDIQTAEQLAQIDSDYEQVIDVEFKFGIRKKYGDPDAKRGRLTFTGTTDTDKLAWSLSVDGKVVSSGVAINNDGVITVHVTKGWSFKKISGAGEVIGAAVGISESSNFVTTVFARAFIGQAAVRAGVSIDKNAAYNNSRGYISERISAVRRALNNWMRDKQRAASPGP